MKHPDHARFIDAIGRLAAVRKSFTTLADAGLILGNDNHIGDIGEYWVRRYYEHLGTFECYGNAKNSPFDIRLTNGAKISVKTITAWSKTGYGTQVRPLDGENWTLLGAVYLAENLLPERLAIVPLEGLLQEPEFQKNAERRRDTEKATKAHPRFQWWNWLSKYEKKFKIKNDDLVLDQSAADANASSSLPNVLANRE